jgi:hypothetical protein
MNLYHFTNPPGAARIGEVGYLKPGYLGFVWLTGDGRPQPKFHGLPEDYTVRYLADPKNEVLEVFEWFDAQKTIDMNDWAHLELLDDVKPGSWFVSVRPVRALHHPLATLA